MTRFVTAGAGFLAAVLWFDLMHDVQVLRHRAAAELPAAVLVSISGYYRRVTTEASPMNRLVAAVMLATLAAIAAQLARGETGRAAAGAALVLTLAPVLLAWASTVPKAVRLGARRDGAAEQTRLARAVCRDHLLGLASIAAVLAVELATGG